MPGLNACNLIGHLGRDIDIRYSADQKPVVTLSVAVKQGYGEHKGTAWCKVTVFGAQAEWLAKQGGNKGDLAIIFAAEYRVDEVAPKNNEPEAKPIRYHSFVVSGYGSNAWIIPKAEHAQQDDSDELPFA